MLRHHLPHSACSTGMVKLVLPCLGARRPRPVRIDIAILARWNVTGTRSRCPARGAGARRRSSPGSAGLIAPRRAADRLKTLEFRMAECQRLGASGPGMGGAERLRPRPGFEVGGRLPDRVGRVEDMVVPLGPTEKIKAHEARHR